MGDVKRILTALSDEFPEECMEWIRDSTNIVNLPNSSEAADIHIDWK